VPLKVIQALKRAGVSQEEIDAFRTDVRARDYDHLLQTVMVWVDMH
jgi:hypothetical protein